jgi:3-oxoacyl-[acyl-carrier-protein] synthase-1
MKKVWIVEDSIVSPLGVTTQENYEKLQQGISGLQSIRDTRLSADSFYGGLVRNFSGDSSRTKFDSLCSEVIGDVLIKAPIQAERTIFILSSTKGNITYLEEGKIDNPRIHLHETAAMLAHAHGFKNHFVISNACISGVMAILVGKRMIEAGLYDHAVVVGADVLSRFVISGFQSLQALSPEACRPFDAQRKGINLGECAAAIVLTGKTDMLPAGPHIRIAGGGLSNDANHISGPSRTGEELGFAIQQALSEAGMNEEHIDFISAHGTATLYNDEMEAKAFNLMKLDKTPLNSLKGYFGHTLGAAGVLETVLSAESLLHDELIPSLGFEQIGVTQNLNVIKTVEHRSLKTCLKTASGFGGCNAAIILHKEYIFES